MKGSKLFNWKFLLGVLFTFAIGLGVGALLHAQDFDTVNGYLGGQEIDPSRKFIQDPEGVVYTDPYAYKVEDFDKDTGEAYKEGFFNGVYYGGVVRDTLMHNRGEESKRVSWYKSASKEGSSLFNDAYAALRADQKQGRVSEEYKLCDFIYYAAWFKR